MAWNFSNKASAESVIEDIRDGKIPNRATAYSILTQIMTNFPGTQVAKEAERVRDSL